MGRLTSEAHNNNKKGLHVALCAVDVNDSFDRFGLEHFYLFIFLLLNLIGRITKYDPCIHRVPSR